MRIQDEHHRAELMLTGADEALTLLAATSKIAKDRQRRRTEATKAYDNITEALPTLVLTTDERIRLNQKLALLRMRLYAASVSD